MHERRTQNRSSGDGKQGGLYVEKLLCYFFELIIVFWVDHAVFRHENNHADFHVCQGEPFPKKQLEELPDVIYKTGEHEQEIPDECIG